MKMKIIYLALPSLCLAILLNSCKQKPVVSPWQKFMTCATNACVPEVLAVKDAFLLDPKPLFEEFILTNERGEDHFVGWTYILRDSVLYNPNYSTEAERTSIKNALLAKAKPYENDPKYGEWAKSMMMTLSSATDASDQQFTGTYTYDLGKDQGTGTIKILAIDEKSLRFDLEIVGKAPAHNQGTMEGTASYVGNVATIATTEFGDSCIITLTFQEDRIIAQTLAGRAGGCGFGHNVWADGTYQLVDDLDPFRGEGGDETPNELLGTWVSTIDPKSVVKLENGQYIDMYDGKEVDKNPFSYHKKCPAGCGSASATPCLKVSGQDDICYEIIFADGKRMDISMIGGRGNTLPFKRKK